jgi:hypothetical protein
MFRCLVEKEASYEFGEALLLRAKICLKENNLKEFHSLREEMKSRLKPHHDILQHLYTMLVQEEKSWWLA